MFSFPAVPPGSYSVKVTAAGFQPYEYKNLVLTQGASVSLPSVELQIEGTRQEVAVVAGAEIVVPTDSPQVSQTLSRQMVEGLVHRGP